METRKYGCIKDDKDKNDLPYLLKLAKKLPPIMDLTPKMPPVKDQKNLGACTAFGLCGLVGYNENIMNHQPRIDPAELFLYYNERAMEGTIKKDNGAQIRDGIKSLAKQGICDSSLWPYLPAKFAQKPPTGAYSAAKLDLITRYERVTTVDQMRDAICSGYPVVFGATLYESFESNEVAETGIVPMPGAGEQILGGHCMLACAYNDNKRRFRIRNSWGIDWGLAGYCEMPYDYFNSDLTSDMWVIYYLS